MSQSEGPAHGLVGDIDQYLRAEVLGHPSTQQHRHQISLVLIEQKVGLWTAKSFE